MSKGFVVQLVLQLLVIAMRALNIFTISWWIVLAPAILWVVTRVLIAAFATAWFKNQ